VTKKEADTIKAVRAFCSQNSTMYDLSAPYFCDASGDGVVGFMAGAAFRMGAESREEFGEKFAPSKEYGELLGHTIYFYSKDAGRPVRFVPPSFALQDITKIPRYRSFNAKDQGCRLWWIEYGGRLDTVHGSEEIKWELWRIVYGVWNHIKNSGEFPEAANLTLEWVGAIPGKREGRRFEGDYMLIQQDIIEQRKHSDAVAFGGWSIDLHPADGVFSEKPGCNQWHSKGIYQIPYRSLYSKNIANLFLAGRIISASHVAFGSSRVQTTCGHAAQAVGLAAALCHRHNVNPRDLSTGPHLAELQQSLLRTGQHIPGFALADRDDLSRSAKIEASSELLLSNLAADGPRIKLTDGWAMMLPVTPDSEIGITVFASAASKTHLHVELRQSSRIDNHTPDVTLEKQTLQLSPGDDQELSIVFAHAFTTARYVFVCFFGDANVSLRCSEQRVTGVLSLCHQVNLAVAKSAVQKPSEDIGVDSFEFWHPKRRPEGQNIAFRLARPLKVFGPRNVVNGVSRPTNQPNAWVADFADPKPALTLSWAEPQTVSRIELMFDTDYDHPMESVLWGHPENRMPFCVRNYRILDAAGTVLANIMDNYQTHRVHVLATPVTTTRLRVEIDHPGKNVPAALFEVRCYKDSLMV
jgi:hypothetical protein